MTWEITAPRPGGREHRTLREEHSQLQTPPSGRLGRAALVALLLAAFVALAPPAAAQGSA